MGAVVAYRLVKQQQPKASLNLLCALAARLLNHSYHEFTSSDSAFHHLERAGQLKHRVTQDCHPGDESDPFVPEFGTRARHRASFIKRHADEMGWIVDWHEITNAQTSEIIRLHDPIALDTPKLDVERNQ